MGQAQAKRLSSTKAAEYASGRLAKDVGFGGDGGEPCDTELERPVETREKAPAFANGERAVAERVPAVRAPAWL